VRRQTVPDELVQRRQADPEPVRELAAAEVAFASALELDEAPVMIASSASARASAEHH
jgi:hypothetical protein